MGSSGSEKFLKHFNKRIVIIIENIKTTNLMHYAKKDKYSGMIKDCSNLKSQIDAFKIIICEVKIAFLLSY